LEKSLSGNKMTQSTTSSILVNGGNLKSADLQTLSFSKLVARDESELRALLSACETYGFFYLDLHDWKSGEIVRDRDATDVILEEWFRLPLEVKEKTETLSDAHGYADIPKSLIC
jgi:isopenicillin N synthase-like dioxygenase